MDKLKASALERELKGSILNSYEVLELINNGKSAAVFFKRTGRLSPDPYETKNKYSGKAMLKS